MTEHGQRDVLYVRVTTSPRLKGRAGRGLSQDLARAAVISMAQAPGNPAPGP